MLSTLRSRKRFLVAVLAGMLIAPACATTSVALALRLDEQSNGRTIEMLAGDRFDIVLLTDQTSGYMWDWAPESTEPGRLVGIASFLGGSTFTPDGRAGSASGTTTFYYSAQGQGRTKLKFVYRPEGDPVGRPTKTFEVDLVVRRRPQ